MDRGGIDNFAGSLRGRFGEDVRVVLSYTTSGEVEYHYMRDDVEQAADDASLDKQVREVLVDGLTARLKEENFSHGPLKSTVHVFEEATVLTFPMSDEEGVAISLEPDARESIRGFIDWCRMTIRADE